MAYNTQMNVQCVRSSFVFQLDFSNILYRWDFKMQCVNDDHDDEKKEEGANRN